MGTIAALVVVLRLPLLDQALSPDEAGFLMVGGHWHAGGTSLYGNYWVDRPPLLVTIFRLASVTGGLVPLRLIGCLAAVAVVTGVAHVARRIDGDRAAAWAGLVAASWCVSPLVGAEMVNGELLAAPFVIWGIAAMLHSLRSEKDPRTLQFAAAAGAAFVAALLVKQNIADVGVFAATVLLVAWRRHELTFAQVRRLALAFSAGSAGLLVVMSGWTLLHGTSLTGVFDAMYPFRIEAGRVMAGATTHQAVTGRLWALLTSWALSGGVAVLVVSAWALLTRRVHGAVAWALGATILFEIVSVLLGGNYWNHYLVQLVAPLSVTVGVLAARRQLWARPLVSALAVLAAVAWVLALPPRADSVASSVGHSIGAASRPGDTIVTVYGHSDVTQSSGLDSPYPYLWSLPLKTLDPDLAQLDRVLSGPAAPTWFVTWSHLPTWGVRSAATADLVAHDYHPVAVLAGRTIYLHNGVRRSTPVLDGTPSTQPLFSTSLKGLIR